MILRALKYTRYKGEPREWSIAGREDSYAYFDNINLLVGKNAAGKSRTLNVIREFAFLLSGAINLENTFSPSQKYEVIFEDPNFTYRYILDYQGRKVKEEKLFYNDKLIVDRSNNKQTDTEGNTISAVPQENQLLATACSDAGEFCFKELVLWGKAIRDYTFANRSDKNTKVRSLPDIGKGEADLNTPGLLIQTFLKGKDEFGDVFVSAIIDGMQGLGFAILDVDVVEKDGNYAICVDEGNYWVMQRDMSQGMFRTLSLFIMMSYTNMSYRSLCLLIDDMGEGLDFDSSKKMIEIIKKIDNSNLQFFITTNDRYVMNQIPLRFWTVIDREYNNKSVFYDYTNSKEYFKDFKYTGLNNFDFLTTGFFRTGFGTIEEEND